MAVVRPTWIAAWVLLAAPAVAEDARPEIGVFTVVHGEVGVAPGQQGPWAAAEVEAAVLDGDWIRTAKRSWAEIALVDGVTLRFDQGEKGELRGAALLRLQHTPEAVRARLRGGGELHAETRGQKLVVQGPAGDEVVVAPGARVWLRVGEGGRLVSAPSDVKFIDDGLPDDSWLRLDRLPVPDLDPGEDPFWDGPGPGEAPAGGTWPAGAPGDDDPAADVDPAAAAADPVDDAEGSPGIDIEITPRGE